MWQPPQGQQFGQPPGGQQQFGQPPAPAGPVGPKNNVLALVGLILGIVSLTIGWTCGITFITGLAGIVCSAIGMSQIKKDPAGQKGKGLAIGGIVTSILAIVFLIIAIIALFALGMIDELT